MSTILLNGVVHTDYGQLHLGWRFSRPEDGQTLSPITLASGERAFSPTASGDRAPDPS